MDKLVLANVSGKSKKINCRENQKSSVGLNIEIGNAAALQMMKSCIQREPTQEQLIDALKMYLGEEEKPITPIGYGKDVVKKALSKLKAFPEKTSDALLWIARAEKALGETEEIPTEELSPDSHKVHSIWVQGAEGIKGDPESRDAVDSRVSAGVQTWDNIIWTYGQDMSKIPKEAGVHKIQLNGKAAMLVARVVDFREMIISWEERPPWVTPFIEILDILMEKRGYVAMSDIMRMIILFKEGGLYVDSKIIFGPGMRGFLERPLVRRDRLEMYELPGLQKENWGMIAEQGCAMIGRLMEETIRRILPLWDRLKHMPENYQMGKPYSLVHKEFHEKIGPWKSLADHSGEIDAAQGVNRTLELENPRGISHSWDEDDGRTGFWS